MTTATTSLAEWTLEGMTEDGEPTVTTIRVEQDPEWTPGTADTTYRYSMTRLVDGEPVDVDGFDSLDDATSHASGVVEQARAEYAENAETVREAHADLVFDVCQDWYMGDDMEAVEVLAGLIRSGKASEALAALKAV